MYFNGDVIITDPCYLIVGDDWDSCDYGEDMSSLGFKTCLVSSTI
ncbi:hypothetical protein FACS1894208_00720 [Clostridia bacterium]|nr:hypothetical protein FACS1894208_00720 [Clostridia bacterium]